VAQTGGDSLLIAFDSIDGAVRCAVKVQQQVPVYDGDQQADRRIRFRVGIDMGDAIPDGTDLHGDAVNIAARLEAASPVGGICVSRPVRDYVHGRLDLAFEPVGELALKNIARPVEAYVLRLDPATAMQPNSGPSDEAPTRQPKTRSRVRSALAIAVAALVVCGAAATGWWFAGTNPTLVPKAPNAAPTAAANQLSPSAVTNAASPPDVGLSKALRLSLVVLPFINLGGEGLDDATVDAFTEDVTADIARYTWVLVTARNSAFTYKGKPIDIKRVGEELGVGYAVEGSVRKVGGTLRVTVQLVSTETGAHVWAERFDVGRDGVGYSLDEIVSQVTFTLQARLADAESARSMRERPANPDVSDVLTRARAVYNLPPSPEKMGQLLALYERAVELDPSSVGALAGLAEALLENVAYSATDDPTAPVKFRRAEELIARAELQQPNDGKVMLARLILLMKQFRCPELIPFAQRTSAAHPNISSPYFFQGICLMFAGRTAEAIPKFEQAIHVHPRNPTQDSRYSLLGHTLLFLGRYEEAISWFQKALGTNPGAGRQTRGNYHAANSAAQALAGDIAAARLSAAEASRLWPLLTARSYFQFSAPTSPVFEEQVSRMRDGLRLAGLRDHADEDADAGLPADNILHTDYGAPTPITVPGAQTTRTQDLAVLVEQRRPLVLDTLAWGKSIPGAIGLWGAGIGGSLSDEYQDRLARKMQHLTRGDLTSPIVALGFNSERYQGRNLALRLLALGYTNVYWYRGGREAWEVAGLPEADLVVQDW
jgi:TolB-like protein/tetratricopeptide (TPR) repeat protein